MSHKIYGAENMVLKALERGPKTVLEIAAYTTLNRETTRQIVASLKGRGAVFSWKDRWTHTYALANAQRAA